MKEGKVNIKGERIKAWATIITAFMSLVGVIVVAFMQSHSATEESVDVIVQQINDKVIPRLQHLVDELEKSDIALIERIVKLETKVEHFENRNIPFEASRKFGIKKKIKKFKRKEIPKLFRQRQSR